MFGIVFYTTASGNSPVREWLKDLTKDDRVAIGEDMMTLQMGFPLGMPLCRPLEAGIFELRSSLSSRREPRLLFFRYKDYLIFVSSFIKKTEKTPRREIDLAKSRMNEYLRNAN